MAFNVCVVFVCARTGRRSTGIKIATLITRRLSACARVDDRSRPPTPLAIAHLCVRGCATSFDDEYTYGTIRPVPQQSVHTPTTRWTDRVVHA